MMQLADAEATTALGRALAVALTGVAGAVIFLEGDLGAGKTTLARGLLRGLGVEGPIRSPTYTLMETYQPGGREVLHLDLYRLNDPRELLNLGLDDYSPGSSLWLVEWPDKGGNWLAPADVRINLGVSGEGRSAQLEWPQRFGPAPRLQIT